MRHRKSGRLLNRTSSHRKAMFRNMTASLLEHEFIKTTLPKAKELRRHVEPFITLAGKNTKAVRNFENLRTEGKLSEEHLRDAQKKLKGSIVARQRLAYDRLRDRKAVGKLFSELGARYMDRPGGYVRILKCGFRTGDKAPMAYVELVDRPEAVALDEDA